MKTGAQIKKDYDQIVHMVENYVRYCQNIGMTGIPLGLSLQPDPPSSFSSLEELKSYLAQCRGCLVALNRQQAVPGEGNSEPILVFVGSSPESSGVVQSSGVAQSREIAQSSGVVQRKGSVATKTLAGRGRGIVQ